MISIRKQLETGSGRFIKGSLILTVGFAIARVLGLAFSLLLGRVMSTDDFGFIQYSILSATIIAIGTQPFMQHTVARFVSTSRTDKQRLDEIASTGLVMLGAIALLTLIGVGLITYLTDTFNPGAIIIFLGLTIYYSYYGLARGFEDSTRLSLVFIASNFIQFIAIVVAYYLLSTRDTLPALAVYGLSYVVPVIILILYHPFPLRFNFRFVRRETAAKLVQFSIPVWISQALYTLMTSGTVFVLTSLAGAGAAGVFVFTRTLCLAFDFLPTAVTTLIMPRVASKTTGTRRLLLLSSGMILVVDLALALVFLLVYPWFIRTFIQEDYLLPELTVTVIILSQIVHGLHGVFSGAIVGQNRVVLELASRAILLVVLYSLCYLLIPSLGIMGAALASLFSGILALLSYVPLVTLYKRHQRRVVAAYG